MVKYSIDFGRQDTEPVVFLCLGAEIGVGGDSLSGGATFGIEVITWELDISISFSVELGFLMYIILFMRWSFVESKR